MGLATGDFSDPIIGVPRQLQSRPTEARAQPKPPPAHVPRLLRDRRFLDSGLRTRSSSERPPVGSPPGPYSSLLKTGNQLLQVMDVPKGPASGDVHGLQCLFGRLLGVKVEVLVKSSFWQRNTGQRQVASGTRKPVCCRSWNRRAMRHGRVPFPRAAPGTTPWTDCRRNRECRSR